MPTNPSSDLPQFSRLMQRRMQPALMLKIGRAPYKDAWDLVGYSHWQWLVSTFGRSTRNRIDDETLRMHMTRGLVDEIIVAAGGLEKEIQDIRLAIEIAQSAANKDLPNSVPQPLNGPPRYGHASGTHAHYAVANGLTWTRAVQERIHRKDPQYDSGFLGWLKDLAMTSRRRNKPSAAPAGLIPSLKDGALKSVIESAYETMRIKVGDARKFNNYVLHAGALSLSELPSGFAIRQDRTLYIPFPDDPGRKQIATWEQFRYKDGRDALAYLEELFEAVCAFIDQMLDAFDAQSLTMPTQGRQP